MIFESLSCLVSDLNEFLRIRLKATEDKVVLAGLVNQDGSLATGGENRIVVTLQNIEKETVTKSNNPAVGRSLAVTGTTININLYILFSAYFPGSNYAESLKFISYIISYLHNKNVFTHANTPTLDTGIDKLIFEMENLSTEKLNNIWAAMGAKYMPSVMFKMRMLTFNNTMLKEITPAISGVSSNGSPV